MLNTVPFLVTQIAQQNEAPNNTKLCFHHPDKEEQFERNQSGGWNPKLVVRN